MLARPQRSLGLAAAALALLLGAVAAHARRHAFAPDGISYLDVGDALWDDGLAGVDPYWSPLYPLLLGGSLRLLRAGSQDELGVAAGLALALFLLTAAAFAWFLRELVAWRGRPAPGGLGDTALVALAWVAFLWTGLVVVDVGQASPDVAVGAVVFALTALLLRGRGRPLRPAEVAALGVLVGVGVLLKAGLLPVVAVALAVAATGPRGLPRAGAALAIAAVLLAPVVVEVSGDAGAPTLSRSGALNYAWEVDGVPRFLGWTGGDPADGTPVSPPRTLVSSPRTVSYTDPVGGSIPAWRDPAHWHDGLRPHVDLGEQVRVLRRSLGELARVLTDPPLGALALLALGLAAATAWGGRRRPRAALRWAWVLPAVAGVLAYLPVAVLGRYVGAGLTVVVVAALAALRLPRGRWAPALLGVAAAVALLGTVVETARRATEDPADDRRVQAAIAADLRALGVTPGSRAAWVSRARDRSLHALWPRLGGTRLTAQVLDGAGFWRAATDEQAVVLRALRRDGAVVLVTEDRPTPASGWRPVGGGAAWARTLPG